jgi:hypothetical protein
MRGAILPLLNTPSWRGAQLKHRDNFTFTLPLSFNRVEVGNCKVQTLLCGGNVLHCPQLKFLC